MLQDADVPEALARITPEWLAGFFDGEGCVHAWVSKESRAYAGIVLSQNDVNILALIMTKFGGIGSLQNQKHNGAYEWRCNGRTALPFLQCIRPHVVIKRRQVELAIRIIDLISQPNTDDSLTERAVLAAGIQKYNQEGKSGEIRKMNKELEEFGYKQ